MAEQGLTSLFPIRALALMGLLEVLPKIFELKALLKQTVADIQARRPDVVVTIELAGVHPSRAEGAAADDAEARPLRGAAGLGVAGKPGETLPGPVGRTAVSAAVRTGLLRPAQPARRFVGHPVLESGADTGDAERFRARHAIAADARILTVMPGSRQTEVSRLLPILEATDTSAAEPVVPVVPLAGPVEAMVRADSSWPVRPILVADTEESTTLSRRRRRR